jgi:K(+)-stimulated pyrophosphate-energized sodium pump
VIRQQEAGSLNTTKKEVKKEVMVDWSSEGEIHTAQVTITSTHNGETTTETKTFTGTKEEIEAQIAELEGVEVDVKSGEKLIKEVEKEIEEVEKN